MITASVDYFAIARLARYPLGKPVVMAIALVLGVGLMFLFVESMRKIAGWVRDRPHAWRHDTIPPLPVLSRIIIVIMILLMTFSTIFNGVQPNVLPQ